MASLPQSDAVSINDLVTLSLLKFSHATTSSPKGKVLWHHVTQSDNKLFAVVDQVTFKNDKGLIVREKILKVVHGGLVIEHVSLEALVHQAREDGKSFYSHLKADEDRVVFVIVKRPMIAIRYQLPGGQIRKIQLNLLPETGYDVLFEILLGFGLPIRDKLVQQGPAPLIQDLSSSNIASHSSSRNNPQPTPGQRVPTFGTEIMTSLPRYSSLKGAFKRDHNFQDPSALALASNHFAVQPPLGPSSSFPSSHNEMSAVRPHPLPGFELRPWSHGSQAYNSNDRTSYGQSSFSLNSPSSPNRAPIYHQIEMTGGGDPLRRSLFPAVTESHRPWTAPLPDDSLGQMLPPKRELPFADLPVRKVPKTLDMLPKDNKAASQTQNQYLEVVPSETKVLDSTPTVKRASESTKALRTKATRSQSITAGNARKQEDARTSTLLTEKKKSQGKLALSGKVDAMTLHMKTTKQAEVAAHQSAPTKPCTSSTSTGSQTFPITNERSSSLSDEHTTSSTKEWIEVIESLVAGLRERPIIKATHSSKRNMSVTDEVSDLMEYASRPAAERREALKAIIYDLIMDESFDTLCEDVESVWQRTGLGM